MNTVGDGAETPHIASVCGDKPPAAFFPTTDDWFAEENHHRIATDHAIVRNLRNLDATIVNGSPPPNLLEKSQTNTNIFSRWISDLAVLASWLRNVSSGYDRGGSGQRVRCGHPSYL